MSLLSKKYPEKFLKKKKKNELLEIFQNTLPNIEKLNLIASDKVK